MLGNEIAQGEEEESEEGGAQHRTLRDTAGDVVGV